MDPEPHPHVLGISDPLVRGMAPDPAPDPDPSLPDPLVRGTDPDQVYLLPTSRVFLLFFVLHHKGGFVKKYLHFSCRVWYLPLINGRSNAPRKINHL